jgi:hypothetical protein
MKVNGGKLVDRNVRVLRKQPTLCLCEVAAGKALHKKTRVIKGNEESCLSEISVLEASHRDKTFSQLVSVATPSNNVKFSNSQRTHFPVIVKTNWLTLFSVNERC